MQIVIKIPDRFYKRIQDLKIDSLDGIDAAIFIRNGTPLPKGHGRWLILSEDKVKENQMTLDFSCQKWIDEVALSNATAAIIEADKEV